MVRDITIDEDFEVKFLNGDFMVEDSDKNHIQLIIRTYLGAWKEFPLVGCGIDYYIASSGQESILKRNINVQLTADNYRVLTITVGRSSDGNITIDPKAERIA
jgi:hypothetical protein